MILEFFGRHGRGGSAAGRRAVGYLCKEVDPMNKLVRTNPPEVLRGDPGRIGALIDSLPFEHTYKSGVLSWQAGEKVSQVQQDLAMRGFENVAFAGLEPDAYEILWVRHTHEGRVELHFIVPRVNLHTGRSMNIDPPGKKSQTMFNTWRREYNVENGFGDPEDPEHRRTFKLPDHVYYQNSLAKKLAAIDGKERKKDERELVHEYLTARIKDGIVKDRTTLVQEVKSAGLLVTREGDNYITVKNPNITDTKYKGVRLRGDIYEREWKHTRSLEEEIGRGREREAETRGREFAEVKRDPGERERELRELSAKLHQLVEERAEFNRKRFTARDRRLQRGLEQTVPAKNALDPSPTVSNDLARSVDGDWRANLVPLVRDANAKRGDLEAKQSIDGQPALVPGAKSLDGSRARAAEPRGRGADLSPEAADRSQREGISEAGRIAPEGRDGRSDEWRAVRESSESGRRDREGQRVLGESGALNDGIRDRIAEIRRAFDSAVQRAREGVQLLLTASRDALESIRKRASDLTRAIQQGDRVIEQYLQRCQQQEQALRQDRGRGGRGL